MQKVVRYADVIVANESEAQAFLAKAGHDKSDLKAGAKILAHLPKENTKRKRLAIVTQGPDPVYTYDAETETLKEWKVLPIKKEEIVDLNGAGDAFMGGFISALAHNKPLETCIEAAMACAHQILLVPGTQYPEKCNYHF